MSLLDRLLRVLLSEGFRDLTTTGISARFHCSKATLYAIAPTKADLIVSVFEPYLADLEDALDASTAANQSPAEKLAAYLEIIDTQMRRMSPVCYRDLVTYGPTHELYRTHLRRRERHLQHILDAGVAAGTFRPVHTVFLTEMITLVNDSIDSGDLPVATGLSSVDVSYQLRDLVLAGMEPGASARNRNSSLSRIAPRPPHSDPRECHSTSNVELATQPNAHRGAATPSCPEIPGGEFACPM